MLNTHYIYLTAFFPGQAG